MTAPQYEFIVGDVVRLSSGGPNMTVLRFKADGEHVECGWFVETGYQSAIFAIASLTKQPVSPQ